VGTAHGTASQLRAIRGAERAVLCADLGSWDGVHFGFCRLGSGGLLDGSVCLLRETHCCWFCVCVLMSLLWFEVFEWL
jgi:hypothetical protein